MNSNCYAPIMVTGLASRGSRLDPNAPKQRRRRRKATQAHSNAARERVLANVPQNAEPVFSWQKRAAAREAATVEANLSDCTLIGQQAGSELREMIYGNPTNEV